VSGTADFVDLIGRGEPVAVERRELTPRERLEEALFMGLRLSQGVDVEAAGRRYGLDAWALFEGALRPFMDERLLLRDGPRLRLTRDGMLVANEVMAAFV
jgi:oxygen-independent coproporphyrinogen-3 oxidase